MTTYPVVTEGTITRSDAEQQAALIAKLEAEVAWLRAQLAAKPVARKEITDNDLPLLIPQEVAVCPVCGARLSIRQIECWDHDGNVMGDGTVFGCNTEPDIDSSEWGAWYGRHYQHPYVDWLPLEVAVVTWVNEHYRYSPR